MWGGSWGVTLALAYAQRHPDRVSEMVLLSITMTRGSDVHWFAHETGRFFPSNGRASGPASPRRTATATWWRPTTGSWNRTGDPARRLQAARDWVAWEDAVLSLEERYVTRPSRWADERFMIGFARLVTHYFSHAAWLDDGELLGNASRLAGIPGVLLHGRLDLAGPPDVAWQLVRAWPGAELHFVPGGHTGDAEMDQRLLEATDRFATRG